MSAAPRQHTPGPYIRDGLFILTQRIENSTGIGELVAKLPEFESRKFVGESETEYQARFRRFCATGDLLAAAPELLAALVALSESSPADFCDEHEYACMVHKTARAAVARATGQPSA